MDGAMKPNPPQRILRDWMPNVSFGEAFHYTSFRAVVVGIIAVGSLTALRIVLSGNPSSDSGDDSVNWTVPDGVNWITQIILTLASLYCGGAVSNWWSDVRNGDAKRAEVSKLDDQIEDEIQSVSEHWHQVINAIQNLRPPTKPDEFMVATRFLLVSQLNSVRSKLRRMAGDIEKKGFSSTRFLEEKTVRFGQVRETIDKLTRALPEGSDVGILADVFGMFDSIEAIQDSTDVPAIKESQSSAPTKAK